MSDTQKCSLSITDPSNVWDLLGKVMQDHFPLREVSFRAGADVRIPSLDVKCLLDNDEQLRNAQHMFNWHNSAFAHIYLLVSESVDEYKKCKPLVGKWINDLTLSGRERRGSWIVLHTRMGAKSAETYDKIFSKINSDFRYISTGDRTFSVNLFNESNPEIWRGVIRTVSECVSLALGETTNKYLESIQDMEVNLLNRSMSLDTQFPHYFLVKESLALLHIMCGRYLEALRIYQDLRSAAFKYNDTRFPTEDTMIMKSEFRSIKEDDDDAGSDDDDDDDDDDFQTPITKEDNPVPIETSQSQSLLTNIQSKLIRLSSSSVKAEPRPTTLESRESGTSSLVVTGILHSMESAEGIMHCNLVTARRLVYSGSLTFLQFRRYLLVREVKLLLMLHRILDACKLVWSEVLPIFANLKSLMSTFNLAADRWGLRAAWESAQMLRGYLLMLESSVSGQACLSKLKLDKKLIAEMIPNRFPESISMQTIFQIKTIVAPYAAALLDFSRERLITMGRIIGLATHASDCERIVDICARKMMLWSDWPLVLDNLQSARAKRVNLRLEGKSNLFLSGLAIAGQSVPKQRRLTGTASGSLEVAADLIHGTIEDECDATKEVAFEGDDGNEVPSEIDAAYITASLTRAIHLSLLNGVHFDALFSLISRELAEQLCCAGRFRLAAFVSCQESDQNLLKGNYSSAKDAIQVLFPLLSSKPIQEPIRSFSSSVAKRMSRSETVCEDEVKMINENLDENEAIAVSAVITSAVSMSSANMDISLAATSVNINSPPSNATKIASMAEFGIQPDAYSAVVESNSCYDIARWPYLRLALLQRLLVCYRGLEDMHGYLTTSLELLAHPEGLNLYLNNQTAESQIGHKEWRSSIGLLLSSQLSQSEEAGTLSQKIMNQFSLSDLGSLSPKFVIPVDSFFSVSATCDNSTRFSKKVSWNGQTLDGCKPPSVVKFKGCRCFSGDCFSLKISVTSKILAMLRIEGISVGFVPFSEIGSKCDVSGKSYLPSHRFCHSDVSRFRFIMRDVFWVSGSDKQKLDVQKGGAQMSCQVGLSSLSTGNFLFDVCPIGIGEFALGFVILRLSNGIECYHSFSVSLSDLEDKYTAVEFLDILPSPESQSPIKQKKKLATMIPESKTIFMVAVEPSPMGCSARHLLPSKSNHLYLDKDEIICTVIHVPALVTLNRVKIKMEKTSGDVRCLLSLPNEWSIVCHNDSDPSPCTMVDRGISVLGWKPRDSLTNVISQPCPYYDDKYAHVMVSDLPNDQPIVFANGSASITLSNIVGPATLEISYAIRYECPSHGCDLQTTFRCGVIAEGEFRLSDSSRTSSSDVDNKETVKADYVMLDDIRFESSAHLSLSSLLTSSSCSLVPSSPDVSFIQLSLCSSRIPFNSCEEICMVGLSDGLKIDQCWLPASSSSLAFSCEPTNDACYLVGNSVSSKSKSVDLDEVGDNNSSSSINWISRMASRLSCSSWVCSSLQLKECSDSAGYMTCLRLPHLNISKPIYIYLLVKRPDHSSSSRLFCKLAIAIPSLDTPILASTDVVSISVSARVVDHELMQVVAIPFQVEVAIDVQMTADLIALVRAADDISLVNIKVNACMCECTVHSSIVSFGRTMASECFSGSQEHITMVMNMMAMTLCPGFDIAFPSLSVTAWLCISQSQHSTKHEEVLIFKTRILTTGLCIKSQHGNLVSSFVVG